MVLSGLLLGLINIVLVVAILIFVGVVVVWLAKLMFNTEIPADVRKWYMIIVGLIALYLVVALIFGLPGLRIIGGSPFPSTTHLARSTVTTLS